MGAEEPAANSSKTRNDLIQEIAARRLGVEGGPSISVEEFWRLVASHVGVVEPASGVVAAAKQVFAELGEEWDDDYLEEDGSQPSIEAYTTLLATLSPQDGTPQESSQATDAEDDEEESEGVGTLPNELSFSVYPSQPEIATLIEQIRDGRLVIDPDWQRHYVWKLKKQRRLIESILLGLPIPSLLLFQEADGKRYVIDGRQRLQTIVSFAAPRGDPNYKRFKTFPAKTEGWRPDEKLNDAAGKYYHQLPPGKKAILDNASLTMHTFTNLPRDKLYQIFARYNTGAVQLKAQEIRNAIYQASPLHKMMWRIAGEHLDDSAYLDDAEREVGTTLRSIMRNKIARYGAYDFVGRYFAFSKMQAGSVAKATKEFMDKELPSEEGRGWDVDALRREFLRVFKKTTEWYEYPLIKPAPDGEFHAFLATVQLVSTRVMLYEHVDKGEVSEDVVRSYVKTRWPAFAEATLKLKQNSTHFWNRQRDWIRDLRQGAGLPSSV